MQIGQFSISQKPCGASCFSFEYVDPVNGRHHENRRWSLPFGHSAAVAGQARNHFLILGIILCTGRLSISSS
jgi:hypothetical protein